MSGELYHTIEQIGREKGLDPEIIIRAVEEAYAAATRKYLQSNKDFGARLDRKTGHFSIFSRQTIVPDDEIQDPWTEIGIDEALALRPDAEVGMVLETPQEHTEAPLTRIAAQAAKQVIYQKVKEAERELIWEEYQDRVSELLTGQVKRFDRGDMIIDLGRTEGIIPRREQSRAEHYNPGDRVRSVLLNVERQGKGPQLLLSRASELLVMKLFEMEVPEIYDGTVTIVSVARDSGERSKVAVSSRDRDVDPVGACVGMKGSRVQAVIREMRGEKIDIVQYDDDPSQYVRNALNPASINRVAVRDYEMRDMEVIVAEDQLSLAIGKRGQNVRLASKLVGWNLEIKSEAEKKSEVEAEMERMENAIQELNSLPNLEPAITTCLLDAGFRTIDEVSMASLEDLVGIEGIDEDSAVAVHDAAEEALVIREAEAAKAEAEAEAARGGDGDVEYDEDEAGEDFEAGEVETDVEAAADRSAAGEAEVDATADAAADTELEGDADIEANTEIEAEAVTEERAGLEEDTTEESETLPDEVVVEAPRQPVDGSVKAPAAPGDEKRG